MSTTEYTQSKSIDYNPRVFQRAERSLICSPFNFDLFLQMSQQRVAISEITGKKGIKNQYTHHLMSELAVDNALVWLIQVGIVRREVDGQGITDSFRLTPLGKQLVSRLEGQQLRQPSWRDRIVNFFTRWLHIPF